MAQPFQVSQPDLCGGLNQSPNKASLAVNQLSECVNFYPWGKTLKKRPGRGKVNTDAGSKVMGLFARKNVDGDWSLLVGQPDSVAVLDGSGLTTVPVADGHTFLSSSTSLWRFRQYIDTVYAVRKQVGRVKAIRSGYMVDAGLNAPATGPTLAQGANGGNLDAGSYIGVYTYFNTATGAESNPSPASNTVGIAAGKMIEWSGITAPTAAGVNAIRLYRTTVDAQGQYYFVAQLAYPGALTLLTDSVETPNMGQSVSLRNGLPPVRAHLIEVFMERLWLSDGIEAFYSELGQPESFFGTSVVDVNPDDGHEIRALHTWNDRLVIGKTNALYYIQGSSTSSFDLQRLTDRAGVIAPDSMRSVENFLFWYDGTEVFRAFGAQVEAIGDELVRKTLETVATSQREFAVGAIYPRLNQYRLSVAANGATSHNTELIYNYRDNAWTVFEYSGAAPHVYGDFYASDYEQLLYSGIGSDGYVYDLNSGTSDDGAAINGRFRSRYFQIAGESGKLGLQLAVRQIMLHCVRSVHSATIELFLDSDNDPYVSRTISLTDSKDWRPRSISNLRRKATAVAWAMEHSGTDGFEVYGAVLHGLAHERTGITR